MAFMMQSVTIRYVTNFRIHEERTLMFKNKNGASQTVNLNPRIGKGFVIGVIIAILALIILRHCFYTQDIGEAIVPEELGRQDLRFHFRTWSSSQGSLGKQSFL